MAVRVLSRIPLHRLFYEFTQIPSSPVQKIRFFSKPSSSPGKIPVESPENSQFMQRISLANLLQRYGFPSSQLHGFIQKNRFLLNSTSSDVENCIRILLSFGLSQNSLISILTSCPRSLDPEFLEKWQLGFLELGFSTALPSIVQRLLEQCGRFRIDPDDLHRNVLVMRDLGFSNATVNRILEGLPAAFVKDPIDVRCRVKFLKDAGIERDDIDRLCFSYPEFLAFGVEGRLKPLFQEIGDLGFSLTEVRRVLLDSPRLLLGMEVGELSRCMELLRSLKCRLPIKERILSKGPLRAGIDLKLRVDCLCQHGLIRRDAFKVLFVEPRSVLYELEDIEKKLEFLLHKIGFCIECLVEFPEYLGVNLEKQIIPRYNVVEHLRSKGGLGLQVGLKHLVKLSRLKFYNLFVKPYPECEEIFGGLVREPEVRVRHPTGLWKVFKPPKFPVTEEDVKNMKLFMESVC